jgi:hypothetical protein
MRSARDGWRRAEKPSWPPAFVMVGALCGMAGPSVMPGQAPIGANSATCGTANAYSPWPGLARPLTIWRRGRCRRDHLAATASSGISAVVPGQNQSERIGFYSVPPVSRGRPGQAGHDSWAMTMLLVLLGYGTNLTLP